jgi:hypothetical protein
LGFISTPTGDASELVDSRNYVWNTSSLAWEKMVSSGAGPSSDVNVTNFPASYPVTGTLTGITNVVHADDNGGSLTVDGTFWQTTQPISGTVSANQGGTWTVQPGNTANTTAWKVDGSAVTQPINDAGGSLTVDGSVAVSNFPVTQPISGSVSVSNFPATQPVSGTVAATQSGTWNVGTITNVVHVDDNGGILTVDGTVGVNNFPATQAVTQSTSPWVVDGSATIQPVSAASLPLPTGAATAAKQPALGTAGTASTDVITVQGVDGAKAVSIVDTLDAIRREETAFLVQQALARNEFEGMGQGQRGFELR